MTDLTEFNSEMILGLIGHSILDRRLDKSISDGPVLNEGSLIGTGFRRQKDFIEVGRSIQEHVFQKAGADEYLIIHARHFD